MYALNQQVLRTDVAGLPIEWLGYKDATRLYATGQVEYSMGERLYRIHGGINGVTGRRSVIDIASIIATQGMSRARYRQHAGYAPPLNNTALFSRDAHICMYCGVKFAPIDLSRDHVRPLSQKGNDHWQNVVTACKRCNNHKAGRTPEDAGMQLLAVPYTPTHAEYVYLQGRHVLADQMAFLRTHFPRSSPLHARAARLK